MQRVTVHRIPMAGPDDTSGLADLIERGTLDPADIICLLGKTEGNGCVNDWTRGFATTVFRAMLADRLRLPPEDIARRVLFIMSGGTEGVMTPHMTVFSRHEVPETSGGGAPVKALAAGIAHTRAFAPEELGTMEQVRAVEAGVRVAMASAEIGDPADVHFVQIKCPLLTAESIRDAERRGQRVATTSTYGSMGYSRGAAALGVALALGEALGLGAAEALGVTASPDPATNVPAPPSAVVSVSSALATAQVVTLPSSCAKIVPYDPSGQATRVLAPNVMVMPSSPLSS